MSDALLPFFRSAKRSEEVERATLSSWGEVSSASITCSAGVTSLRATWTAHHRTSRSAAHASLHVAGATHTAFWATWTAHASLHATEATHASFHATRPTHSTLPASVAHAPSHTTHGASHTALLASVTVVTAVAARQEHRCHTALPAALAAMNLVAVVAAVGFASEDHRAVSTVGIIVVATDEKIVIVVVLNGPGGEGLVVETSSRERRMSKFRMARLASGCSYQVRGDQVRLR